MGYTLWFENHFVYREHDKNPTALFETLRGLKNEGLDFKISVLGQGFTDIPGKITFYMMKGIMKVTK